MKTKPKNLFIDVDGVMTTGHFIYSKQGKVLKAFGPHDNDGIKMLEKYVKIFFVTADRRGFSISKKRIVDDMGQKLFLVDEASRLKFISKYNLNNTAFIGDGIHDAIILKKCLYGIAPRNARIEARRAADYVTASRSGEGAVLDACLQLYKKYFK